MGKTYGCRTKAVDKPAPKPGQANRHVVEIWDPKTMRYQDYHFTKGWRRRA